MVAGLANMNGVIRPAPGLIPMLPPLTETSYETLAEVLKSPTLRRSA